MSYNNILNPLFSSPNKDNIEGYLIHHNQPKSFKMLAARADFDLNRQMGRERITPLMVAVMEERFEFIYFLLANKKFLKLDLQDFRGYTALHHAALSASSAAYNLLIGLGINTGLKDRYRGTGEDLYRLTHPTFQPKYPLYYGDKVISLAEWEELNHTRFTEEYVLDRKIAIRMWAEEEKVLTNTPEDMFRDALYEEFLKNPLPRLSFRKDPVVGNTAYLLDDVRAGSILAEYVGDYNPYDEEKNVYAFPPVACNTHRGRASLIQDGTPNMFPEPIAMRGLHERVLFIALRDISAGETLTYDYGLNHSVKFHNYVELRGEELREWLQGRDLLSSALKISSFVPTLMELSAMRDLALVQYIIQTPQVLVSLFVDQLISKELLTRFVANSFPPQIHSLFDNIAEQAVFSDTPRDKAFIAHVKSHLEKGNYIMGASLLANQKRETESLNPDNPSIGSTLETLEAFIALAIQQQR